MKEQHLKLNPQGFSLCVENKKKATLRLGKREVDSRLTIENKETGETLSVEVLNSSTMLAKEAYEDQTVLKLLGYQDNPGQLPLVMKKHYPEIENNSVVTLITWK